MRAIITARRLNVARADWMMSVKYADKKAYEQEISGGIGEAAAYCVEKAMECEAVIIADTDVMKLIPTEYGGLR